MLFPEQEPAATPRLSRSGSGMSGYRCRASSSPRRRLSSARTGRVELTALQRIRNLHSTSRGMRIRTEHVESRHRGPLRTLRLKRPELRTRFSRQVVAQLIAQVITPPGLQKAPIVSALAGSSHDMVRHVVPVPQVTPPRILRTERICTGCASRF